MRIVGRGQRWSVRWSDLTVALASDRLLRSARKEKSQPKRKDRRRTVQSVEYRTGQPSAKEPTAKSLWKKASETAAATSRNVKNPQRSQRWSVCWSDLTVALESHRLLRSCPTQLWGRDQVAPFGRGEVAKPGPNQVLTQLKSEAGGGQKKVHARSEVRSKSQKPGPKKKVAHKKSPETVISLPP